MKASKSTSVASWPGFTFAGFFSWAGFFLGGVVQPPAARPNISKTKAKNLTAAFIGDTFVSVFWEWQVHPCARSQNAESNSGECSTAILAVGPTPKAFGVELGRNDQCS